MNPILTTQTDYKSIESSTIQIMNSFENQTSPLLNENPSVENVVNDVNDESNMEESFAAAVVLQEDVGASPTASPAASSVTTNGKKRKSNAGSNGQRKRVKDAATVEYEKMHEEMLAKAEQMLEIEFEKISDFAEYDAENGELLSYYEADLDGLEYEGGKIDELNDVGLASYVLKFVRGDIKIVDEKDNGFIWSEIHRLWLPCKNRGIRSYIVSKVTPVFYLNKKRLARVLKDYKDEHDLHSTLERAEKYVKAECRRLERALEVAGKLLKKISNYRNSQAICSIIAGHLLDEDFLLNVNNRADELPLCGSMVINLRTGETRQRNRSDLWSYELQRSLVPEKYLKQGVGAFDDMTQFLSSIMRDNKETLAYLMASLGLGLTKELPARAFYIWHGTGGNGKSVLAGLLRNMMKGSNCVSSLSESVMLQTGNRTDGGRATPELMPLLTARLAFLNEIGEKQDMNERRMKALCGGDEIAGRALFKNEIYFVCKAKLNLLCNHVPSWNVSDKAMVDRVKLIPFLQRFEKTPANDAFVKSLESSMHLDVLFTLLVQAAQSFYKNGMPPESAEMLQQKKAMIAEIDSISQWLASDNVFTKHEPGVLEVYGGDATQVRANASDALADYKTFCQSNGFTARRSIKNRMEQLGFKQGATNGRRYFKGIVLEHQFRVDMMHNANVQGGSNAGTDAGAFFG